jgi:hypothetical protein
MPAGRPRTTSFDPAEMIALGEEMILWIKARPDILHLSEWYTIEKGFIYKEWKAFIQMPEFLPYYEKALKLVGLKYLDKESRVRDGISHRWMRVYFPDLREEEEATKDADSERKKIEVKVAPMNLSDLMKMNAEELSQK